MITPKKIFLSTTLIISSLLSANALAASIPEGTYTTPVNLAGYNIIYELKSTRSGVTVNNVKAHESSHLCSMVMPGGPCSTKVTWATKKNNKPQKITETIIWTSGVFQQPGKFALRVTNNLGQEGPELVKVK